MSSVPKINPTATNDLPLTSPHGEAMVEAALAAGEILLRHYQNRDLTIHDKGDLGDIVTAADLESQDKVFEILRRHFPNYNFIGEEGETIDSNSDYYWCVDPLDGTVNFSLGIPLWGLSIALTKKDPETGDYKPIAGILYQPLWQEILIAEEGHGAFLGEKTQGQNIAWQPIDFANYPLRKGKVISFPPPYPFNDSREELLGIVDVLSKIGQNRYIGSSTIEFFLMAKGQYDSYVQRFIFFWDVAAGDIILREAGCSVAYFDGAAEHPRKGIIMAKPAFMPEILDVLAPYLGKK